MRALAAAIVFAGMQAPTPIAADPVADFYRGKQIELLIGMTQGAAYDVDARLIARHMPKYIPGNPVIVPKQLTGAGSVRAALYTYAVAPKDGTTLLAPHQGLPLQQALKDPTLKADMTQFHWIGTPVQETNILFSWHTSGIKTLADATKKEVTLGASGATSASAQYPAILNNIMGTKFKVIAGYAGGADIDLALERGEVAARGSANWEAIRERPGWLAGKKINVLVQIGLKKPADLQEPPLLTDLARNAQEREALRLLSAPAAIGHPILVGPGVPADRVAALRKAFDATVKDPEFLADAAKANREILPASGAELQSLVDGIVNADAKAVDTLLRLIGEVGK
jgi:tripartite-type tricarboxylate transporter receptor subunit TctC